MSTIQEVITGGKIAASAAPSLRVGNVTQYGATAAGTDQAGALAITTGASIVVCTTVGLNSGVRLPATRFRGDQVTIVNRQGTNALNVYPATGDNIDGGSANAAVVLPVNSARTFTCRIDGTSTWA